MACRPTEPCLSRPSAARRDQRSAVWSRWTAVERERCCEVPRACLTIRERGTSTPVAVDLSAPAAGNPTSYTRVRAAPLARSRSTTRRASLPSSTGLAAQGCTPITAHRRFSNPELSSYCCVTVTGVASVGAMSGCNRPRPQQNGRSTHHASIHRVLCNAAPRAVHWHLGVPDGHPRELRDATTSFITQPAVDPPVATRQRVTATSR